MDEPVARNREHIFQIDKSSLLVSAIPVSCIGSNHRSPVRAELISIRNCRHELSARRLELQTCRKGSSEVSGIPIIPFGGFARRLISAGPLKKSRCTSVMHCSDQNLTFPHLQPDDDF